MSKKFNLYYEEAKEDVVVEVARSGVSVKSARTRTVLRFAAYRCHVLTLVFVRENARLDVQPCGLTTMNEGAVKSFPGPGFPPVSSRSFQWDSLLKWLHEKGEEVRSPLSLSSLAKAFTPTICGQRLRWSACIPERPQ